MFDPDRYVMNATVLENLVFGVAVPEALGGVRIEAHPYMIGDHRRRQASRTGSSPWAAASPRP